MATKKEAEVPAEAQTPATQPEQTQEQQSAPPQKRMPTLKEFFDQDNVKHKFQELLGKRAQGFVTSVLQIVSNDTKLRTAEPMSVYNAAAMAAILDLPLNNNLGFAYIVPYNQSYKDAQGRWQKKLVAQFQMGYKGFIQLAQRSGLFKTIASSPIYEGQLKEQNPLTGFTFDFTKRDSDKVIGYASYFSLINGFEKTLYMTVEEVTVHGKSFSQTFRNDTGLWKDRFDAMANKTVLKLLLSRFAPLSIEMQRAVVTDQAVIRDVSNVDAIEVDYADNKALPQQVDVEDLKQLLEMKRDVLQPNDIEAAERIIAGQEVESYPKLLNLLREL